MNTDWERERKERERREKESIRLQREQLERSKQLLHAQKEQTKRDEELLATQREIAKQQEQILIMETEKNMREQEKREQEERARREKEEAQTIKARNVAQSSFSRSVTIDPSYMAKCTDYAINEIDYPKYRIDNIMMQDFLGFSELEGNAEIHNAKQYVELQEKKLTQIQSIISAIKRLDQNFYGIHIDKQMEEKRTRIVAAKKHLAVVENRFLDDIKLRKEQEIERIELEQKQEKAIKWANKISHAKQRWKIFSIVIFSLILAIAAGFAIHSTPSKDGDVISVLQFLSLILLIIGAIVNLIHALLVSFPLLLTEGKAEYADLRTELEKSSRIVKRGIFTSLEVLMASIFAILSFLFVILS